MLLLAGTATAVNTYRLSGVESFAFNYSLGFIGGLLGAIGALFFFRFHWMVVLPAALCGSVITSFGTHYCLVRYRYGILWINLLTPDELTIFLSNGALGALFAFATYSTFVALQDRSRRENEENRRDPLASSATDVAK